MTTLKRRKQKEKFRRRQQAADADSKPIIFEDQFTSFSEFRQQAYAYIKQEIHDNPDPDNYHESKRAKEVYNLCKRKAAYAEKMLKKYQIRGEFRWPKWTEMEPKKNETRKRVSPFFKPVYESMWSKILTYKKTKDLTEKLKLSKHDDRYYAIVIPDLEKMAEDLEASVSNIFF